MEQAEYTTSIPGREPTWHPRRAPWSIQAGLRRQLQQLYLDLLAVIERDPEQEIIGIALPVVDCVLSAARQELAAESATALTEAMVELISPATVGEGAPIRALDTWLVVGQLLAALSVASPPGGSK